MDVSQRAPVILIPGLTGSRLEEAASGKIVWGKGENLLCPRDGGYSLALPIDDPEGGGGLAASGGIRRVSLFGIIHKDIYGSLEKAFHDAGYTTGDIRSPRREDSFYIYDYDWRRDNIYSAWKLHGFLQALRKARGEEVLEVNIIAQSNGGHIARWLAKHGSASLEEAESGQTPPSKEIQVDKLMLVGTSNGGSLKILHLFNEGRRYIPVIGRKIQPEVLFTFPSVFQDLPVYRRDLFVDPGRQGLDLDLFDVETWKKMQWSVFHPAVLDRIETTDAARLFGDASAREAHLRDQLDRARRFASLLRQGSLSFQGTRYYFIQGQSHATPERALVDTSEDVWRTLIYTRNVKNDQGNILEGLFSPGDAHAPLASQRWLSPQETAAVVQPVFYFEERHMELISKPETHRQLLRWLGEN